MLNNKFKLKYNETIKSLQFYKLLREANENTEELMGKIRVVAIECNYKELDKHLKEQVIHWLNDGDMLAEIIRELTKTEVTSEQVLVWAERIKSQRAQVAAVNSPSEVKDFGEIHARKANKME